MNNKEKLDEALAKLTKNGKEHKCRMLYTHERRRIHKAAQTLSDLMSELDGMKIVDVSIGGATQRAYGQNEGYNEAIKYIQAKIADKMKVRA